MNGLMAKWEVLAAKLTRALLENPDTAPLVDDLFELCRVERAMVRQRQENLKNSIKGVKR